MKVSLDLRPRALVESQKKRLNVARLFMTLFLLSFMLLGISTLLWGFWNYISLRDRVAFLEDTLSIQRAQNARLANELKRLSDEEKVFVSALKLLQDELPALEFLKGMESSLPRGVWIRNFSLVPGKISIQGSSYNEDDVVEFGKGLLDTPVVAAVDFPVTTRVVRDGQSLVDFSLVCSLRDFVATIPVAPAAGKGADSQ
ncbi:MAG: hypothetical protein EOM17_14190 [Synergistales bacterium]|nr:hypothetical protein [Synergistales bacterium]